MAFAGGFIRSVPRHEQMKFGRQRSDVNRHVDACRLAAREGGFDCGSKILYFGHALGVASERRGNLVILGVAKLRANQASFSGNNFLKMLGSGPTVVVHDHDNDRQLMADHGVKFCDGEADSAVAREAQNGRPGLAT